MSTSNRHKWLALAVLAATQFMIVIDVSIVNVALRDINNSLHFSQSGLQWIFSAYTLTFGGFLLLGGRIADLMGRRRVFMIGAGLFALASLTCGLAQSSGMLIAARAVQGLGAAIVAPAALSILSVTFAEGRERNTALGIWGAISGLGGAAGVLLGGVLTDGLGWEWIFFVNVPLGAAVIAVAPRLLVESRSEGATRSFDVGGSVLGTLGLASIVFGLVKAPEWGWTDARVLACLLGGAACVAAFLGVEGRLAAPILPLGIFRNRALSGANTVGFMLGASMFAMFFFLSIYMQQVLGYSAMKTGAAYVLFALVVVVSSGISQALVTRLGVRPVLIVGMALLTVGLLWFARLPVHGTYLADLVPGFVVAGVGLGFSFVPVGIAALTGVREHEAGVASGLINTSQQIGGALGVAVLTTVWVTFQDRALTDGTTQPGASVHGLQWAFGIGAALAVIGLLATLLTIRAAQPAAEGVAATETV